MSEQIIRDRGVEALKVAAAWPGADQATIVTLATVLAATGADGDGARYFAALAASQPFGRRCGQVGGPDSPRWCLRRNV
jgi:hypothetical protein